ncbi:transporter [Streptomyces sp. BI20]|uniref:transporter n=1 Tax=Streptomyces sp. BI20 TaxID=3403460 RepID=UPI003C707B5C
MSAGGFASAVPAVPLTPVFVRLKLSLLGNGLRTSGKRKAVFIGSLVMTLLLAALALLLLSVLRGSAYAGEVVAVLGGFLALGWLVMPLFFVTGDETLDPTRLAMLPLRPRPLVRALLVSSLIGIGPLFTLCLAIGSVIALADGPAAWAAGVLAVPLVLLGCVTLARAMATANVRMLTSRKGRDLAVLSGLVIAVGAQFLNFGVQKLTQPGGMDALEPIAEVVRWVPPATGLGMVESVSEGAWGRAAAQCALSVAAVVALVWSWERSLTKVMVTPDGSTSGAAPSGKDEKERSGTSGSGGLWALLPAGRAGAVVQRSLRYLVREPKVKASFVTALAIGLIVPVFNALQGDGTVWLACFGSAMLGVQLYNQFGQDTSAFWMVAQTIGTPRDAYEELRARALALALVTVPFTVLVAVVTAAVVGDWGTLPEVVGVSLALVGGMTATGVLGSVYFPYSIPTDGAFKSVAPGQAGLAWLSILGGVAASLLLSLPVLALTIGLHVTDTQGLLWLVLPVGVVWGALVTWGALRLSAGPMHRRLPEILAAVSKG